MNAVLKKSKIFGSVEIPVSKSVAHRVMIASFLAGEDFNFGLSGDDVLATRNCLFALKKLFDGEADVALLDAGESGSTLRFLLPIVCALGANAKIDGLGRLPDRPIGELLDVLRAHGANIIGERLPLFVKGDGESCLAKGRLEAGEYVINAGVSSQYITGLLFALPLLQGDSKIVLEGTLVSKDYVELTLEILKKFSVSIERTDYGFFVKGNQKYVKPQDFELEGDWSSAAFPLALGLICGEVEACGISAQSLQADRAFFDISKKMGGDISFSANGCVSKKSSLHGIDFDASNCPDIVPILCVLAGFASGETVIRGVDRLRQKESDRLTAVQELLGQFGIITEYESNLLTICGKGEVFEAERRDERELTVDGFADHRIAMSGIVAGLAVGGTKVLGVECINKSYPSFTRDIAALGANIELTKGENNGI